MQLARAADKDGDRFPASVDCRDDNPAINPGVVDRPGDRIDQDCDGGDAPFPVLGARIFGAYQSFPGFTRFTGLAVTRSPGGVKVRLACKGEGCPFKARRRKIRKATSRYNLAALIKGAKLRRGAKLRIRVSRTGYIGAVTTWTMRAPAGPRRIDRCLVPGRKRPARC